MAKKEGGIVFRIQPRDRRLRPSYQLASGTKDPPTITKSEENKKTWKGSWQTRRRCALRNIRERTMRSQEHDHLQSRPKSHRGVPGRAGLRAIVGLENPMRMFPLAKSRLAQTRHCSWSELVTFAHGTPTHVAYYERAHRIKRQSKTASGQGRLRARSRACLRWV
jgi:hypothetical protein